MNHTTEQKSTLIFAGMMTYIPNSPDMSPDESLHYARMAVQHARALEFALSEDSINTHRIKLTSKKETPIIDDFQFDIDEPITKNISMEFEATHPDDMPQPSQPIRIHPFIYLLAGIGLGYLLTFN